MLVIKIILDLSGKTFSPNKFIDLVDLNDFKLFEKNEPNDLIFEDRDDIYEFGSIAIINKENFGFNYDTDRYEKWYSSFFEKHKKVLDSLGLDSITYTIDVFYSTMCSLDFSCSSNYQLFMNYNFSIPMNVYKMEEADIVKMLIESGISKELIEENINNKS